MLRPIVAHSKKLVLFFTSRFILYLALLGNVALVLATLIFYVIEKDPNPDITGYFDCFWWGVVTITTVGYGDVVPVTTAGRVIAIVLMYSGTVLFIAFIGLLVAYWTRETVEQKISPLEAEVEEEEAVQERILTTLKGIELRLERLEKRQS